MVVTANLECKHAFDIQPLTSIITYLHVVLYGRHLKSVKKSFISKSKDELVNANDQSIKILKWDTHLWE